MSELKDKAGRYRTESLFKETITAASAENYTPVYSLKEYDNDYPSLYRIYISCIDEYEFANKVFGSTAHWNKLCNCKWFIEGDADTGHRGLNTWREDMIMRDISYAKKKLKEMADDGDHNAIKKLLDFSVAERKAVKPNKVVDDMSKEDRKQEQEFLTATIKRLQIVK